MAREGLPDRKIRQGWRKGQQGLLTSSVIRHHHLRECHKKNQSNSVHGSSLSVAVCFDMRMLSTVEKERTAVNIRLDQLPRTRYQWPGKMAWLLESLIGRLMISVAWASAITIAWWSNVQTVLLQYRTIVKVRVVCLE